MMGQLLPQGPAALKKSSSIRAAPDQVSGEDGDGGGEGGEEEGAAVWPDQAQHPEEEEDFQGGGDECEAQEDEDWEVDG